jgi:hypothetical protein
MASKILPTQNDRSVRYLITRNRFGSDANLPLLMMDEEIKQGQVFLDQVSIFLI